MASSQSVPSPQRSHVHDMSNSVSWYAPGTPGKHTSHVPRKWHKERALYHCNLYTRQPHPTLQVVYESQAPSNPSPREVHNPRRAKTAVVSQGDGLCKVPSPSPLCVIPSAFAVLPPTPRQCSRRQGPCSCQARAQCASFRNSTCWPTGECAALLHCSPGVG